MFYDARGSELFERITELQEYYPTRTERSILASSCDAIVAAACRDTSKASRLVELGAGTASKTTILLDAAARLQSEVLYAPVDVSPDALEVARETIAAALPDVCFAPIVTNYVTDPPQLESFDGVTLGLYIGSSIGNFEAGEARTILRNLRSQLQPGDALLLGVDMVKDEPTLVAAYDDRDGVTAQFNLNVLHRLNRELHADFYPSRFRHRALWNSSQSRIEMHLESTHNQRISIPAAQLDLYFEEGERIHTENSYKFTGEKIRALLADADFEVEQTWTDERGWFSVTLARVQSSK
jgi:dimethylhistidine N-methyltransferase